MSMDAFTDLNEEIMRLCDFHTELGWTGAFTRKDAPQALYRPGTRIKKTRRETGDAQPIGAEATVLGSIYLSQLGAAYFVEWDANPKVAILVVGWKVEPDTK